MSIYARRTTPPRPPKPANLEFGNHPAVGGQLWRCDICDRAFYKDSLQSQRGHLVCPRCFDWPAYQEPKGDI